MTEQWLKDIVSALRDTDVHQVIGRLAEWNYIDGEYVLEGKCALGVISCATGQTLEADEYGVLMNSPQFPDILTRAGVPVELAEEHILPDIRADSAEDEESIYALDDDRGELVPLFMQIYGMNDTGMTFNEIADFLEITYEEYI